MSSGRKRNRRGLHRPRRRYGAAPARHLARVAEVDAGDGVVLLTDMFGGTPSNLAISVMDKANVEVIAGINLPMLIKLASAAADREPRRPCAAPRKPGANTSTSPRNCWPTPVSDGPPLMPRGRPARAVQPASQPIRNQRGLHARAAAKFVKLAIEFDADITVARAAIDGPADRSWG